MGDHIELSPAMQKLHGVAILFVVLAIALVMAAMFLLAIGPCIDVFLVMMLSWSIEMVALISSIVVFCFVVLLWEVYPTLFRRHHIE
jgi:hypothetical protein